jgi:MoaA/NifB/PqqE/SkfB family radical SAM enzyme
MPMHIRKYRSHAYNYNFDKTTGFFQRWGKHIDDDPAFSPIGPEILDIEVTTICPGVTGQNGKEKVCEFCYKSNTPNGSNMSLTTFQKVIDKMPSIMQLAIGADSHATSNPELFEMMAYARSKGIIPNITVAEISEETAEQLVQYCGAVAVSRYANKDVCYDTVQRLTSRGLTQVNIHVLLSNQTYDMVMETLQDRLTDPRLKHLNAIVILSLKQKGRGKHYTCATQEQFRTLTQFALDNKIGFGFDSCSCHKFLKAVEGHSKFKQFNENAEPCESGCFSAYVDVHGKYFPCSFTPNQGDWTEGLDVVNCKDFLQDIWMHAKVKDFRETLLKRGRHCPLFNI